MPTRPAAQKEMRRGANVALSRVKMAAIARKDSRGNRVRADALPPPGTRISLGPVKVGPLGMRPNVGRARMVWRTTETQQALNKAPAPALVKLVTRPERVRVLVARSVFCSTG